MRGCEVSVLIATYNRAESVGHAIQSALGQTFCDLEVVVIVDGSTDQTVERLKSFAGKIRVVSQENAGLGAARNRGIAEAKGRYVAFLDDDDIWYPRKLEVQLAYMRAHPECSLCTGPAEVLGHPGKLLYDARDVCGPDGLVRRPLSKVASGLMMITPSATMYDREKAPDARFLEHRRCLEDGPFLVEALARGQLGIASFAPLVQYAVGSAGSLAGALDVWTNGRAELRRMLAAGELPPSLDGGMVEVREYVGFIGRVAARRNISHGRAGAALAVYLWEFPHQARLGRIKFLVGAPLLTIKRWLAPGRPKAQ